MCSIIVLCAFFVMVMIIFLFLIIQVYCLIVPSDIQILIDHTFLFRVQVKCDDIYCASECSIQRDEGVYR